MQRRMPGGLASEFRMSLKSKVGTCQASFRREVGLVAVARFTMPDESRWRGKVAKSTRKQPDYDFSRFEASLAELEKIVARMESGDQSLEDSLKDFERGVTLTRNCQTMLKSAEQKVEKLVKEHGEIRTEPFADDQADDQSDDRADDGSDSNS